MGERPIMLIPALLLYVYLYPDSIVAQASTEAAPWLTGVNLGIAGIFLWAFATGRIVAQGTMTKCEEKLTAAEEELRERNREARESLVPTLVKATEILGRYLERTPPPPPKGR